MKPTRAALPEEGLPTDPTRMVVARPPGFAKQNPISTAGRPSSQTSTANGVNWLTP